MSKHAPTLRRLLANEHFTQAMILLGVIMLLFPGTFLHGEASMPASVLYERIPFESYAPDDLKQTENIITSEILAVFNNYNVLATRAFSMGEWPLWNDLQMTGAPLLANYQSTVLYPLRLVFRAFEHYFATTLYYMIKIWLCGFTAYLFARGYGYGIAASRLVSVGWMLSMFNMCWWYLPITDVSAWVPLLMLGVEWIIDGRYKRGIFLGALGGTLLLLGGHPESSFAFGLGVGAYFVVRLALDRRTGKRLWKPILACSVLWTIAIGVCMSQIVPFTEYLLHSQTFSERAIGNERKPFIRNNTAVALWVPRFYGFTADDNIWDRQTVLENSNYVSLIYPGIPIWICMALLMTRGKIEKRERHRRIALIVPSLFAFLLAYDAPILDPIHSLPIFNSMWPMHHVSFAMFAMPILAGMGLEHWLRVRRSVSDLAYPIGLTLLVALTVLATFVVQIDSIREHALTSYVGFQMSLALLFVLVSLLLLVVSTKVVKHRLLVVHTVWVVLATDLLYACHDLRPSAPASHMYPDTSLTTYLQSQPQPFRVAISVGPGMVASIRLGCMVPYGVEESWGYDGIYPERVTTFFDEIKTSHWRKLEPILAIDHYLPPPGDLAFDSYKLVLIGILDGTGIWDNPDALPRARLVGVVRTAEDRRALFAAMKQPDFDPKTMAITELPPSAPLPNTASADLGTARMVKRTTLTTSVLVDAKQPCALIFADQWYPGWKAYVDDVETELWPAYYCMRGVLVPEGRHRVDFRYEPASFTIGMILSVTMLFLSATASVYLLLRGQRVKSSKSTEQT